MVLNELSGMKFESDRMSFAPYLPSDIHFIEIKDFTYRNALLNIQVHGNGKAIKSFSVDGKSQSAYFLAPTISETHNVLIEVE